MRTLNSKVVIATITTFILSIIIIFGISYYTVQQFTFADDRIFYGKKQSELAAEIREELLRRPDINRISFKSIDGVTLSGFLIKRPNATANLILCHGYKGSKEFMYGYVDLFKHCNILLFDFRAHGESEGIITSIGCHEYKDVIAATTLLKQTIENKQLPTILLGVSMGGAASLKATEENPNLTDAIIVDSTFSDLEKMFLHGYYLKVNLPYYPFFPVIRSMFHYLGACDIKKMSTINCVKKIKKPIMFIHSCDDNFIKPYNSVELFSHAISQKTKLWIGPKCRHGWLHSYHPQLYKYKVEKFLNKALFKTPSHL